MILLDTNYLIRALMEASEESDQVIRWTRDHEELCTSSIAWYEFLCGPVDDEGILLIQSLVQDHILPFTSAQSAESARLFNATGRKRHLRVDAMIASAAILTHSKLATGNVDVFMPFIPFGLHLV